MVLCAAGEDTVSNIFNKLVTDGAITSYPKFLASNIQSEVIMGSVAYGVSDDTSDVDVYGWCIPPKDFIFPHLRGEIDGFSTLGPRFDQFQQHHIAWPVQAPTTSYDVTIFSIVKYFRLCMECNPNMIDSLFAPRHAVLFSTPIAEMVREKRRLFLHKGAWFKFKGYSYSQMHKMRIKKPEGKRKEQSEKYGLDLKYAYHIVRLLNEAEQILTEHDLDITRNREQLKAIRRGEWTLEQVEQYFETKERELESAYTASTLRHSPDEHAIRGLLMDCLEHHYGSLAQCVLREDAITQAFRQIKTIVDNVSITAQEKG